MTSIKHIRPITKSVGPTQGFALIEALVALVVFSAVIGTMLPLFGAYKVTTLQNDTRLGAAAVAQRVMDSLRRATVANLPTSGTVPNMPTELGGQSLNVLTYKGKNYKATITYCDPDTNCSAQYSRLVSVKVYDCHTRNDTALPGLCPAPDSNPVFQLETVYTELRN